MQVSGDGDAKELAEMALFNANGTNFRPGTVKVVDQNGDKKIDAADYVFSVHPGRNGQAVLPIHSLIRTGH